MMVMPEIRRSELNAVRRFLVSVRDEEHTEQSLRGPNVADAPLRARIARARQSERATLRAGTGPGIAMAV